MLWLRMCWVLGSGSNCTLTVTCTGNRTALSDCVKCGILIFLFIFVWVFFFSCLYYFFSSLMTCHYCFWWMFGSGSNVIWLNIAWLGSIAFLFCYWIFLCLCLEWVCRCVLIQDSVWSSWDYPVQHVKIQPLTTVLFVSCSFLMKDWCCISMRVHQAMALLPFVWLAGCGSCTPFSSHSNTTPTKATSTFPSSSSIPCGKSCVFLSLEELILLQKKKKASLSPTGWKDQNKYFYLWILFENPLVILFSVSNWTYISDG